MELRRKDAREMEGFGRLRDGVSIEEAKREDMVGQHREAEYPALNKGMRPAITPYTQRAVGGELRLILPAREAAVAFLLLVACANAANLVRSR